VNFGRGIAIATRASVPADVLKFRRLEAKFWENAGHPANAITDPSLFYYQFLAIFTLSRDPNKKDWFMYVEVRNNDLNGALKLLKKLVYKERLLIEYRQKMQYEKPSEKRRRKRAEAILRRKKMQQEASEDSNY
jgi:small subunit ribosomal protein S21